LAWHFCTDKNSKKLEKVQERALRFVYDDYTRRSALSCTFSNFFEFLSVQKCQAKGQKLKLLRKKVWNIVNLLNLSLCGTTFRTISELKTVSTTLKV
jgi:N12 class adenine-specific DNA methylase